MLLIRFVLVVLFFAMSGEAAPKPGTYNGNAKYPYEKGIEGQPKERRKRNFVTDKSILWPKGVIPYEIAPETYSVEEEEMIHNAVKEINRLTCVRWVPRFVPRTRITLSNLVGHTSYVLIDDLGEGTCTSDVGRISDNTSQTLNLTPSSCFYSVATPLHEMLHAMGAEHEQSRPDSDRYIQIYWNRINETDQFAFDITEEVRIDTPYDASSLMQYRPRAFTTTGDRTIEFIDRRLQFLAVLADYAEHLTFYDVLDITEAYNCAENCTDLGCQNAGFMDWRCKCYCPDVLIGKTCTQPLSDKECGGVVNVAAGQEIFISSPGYPYLDLDYSWRCVWLIQGEPNNFLRGTIVDMDITDTCEHWLEIRYNLLGQTGPRRCGKATDEVWEASQYEFSNKMIVIFDNTGDSGMEDQPKSRGFKMKFESMGTGCVGYPCKFGTCSSPINSNNYTCTCDYGVKGKNCDVLTEHASVGCTVEVGKFCMLEQDGDDDFDWEFQSGFTPSTETGPHNAAEGFLYWYTEAWADGLRHENEKAILFTDMDFPVVQRCLRFWYHMYGSGMGTLNVWTLDRKDKWDKVFGKEGDQGDQWIKAEVDIPAMDGLMVVFESIRGKDWTSDMALDDIWLIPGTCETADDHKGQMEEEETDEP